MTELPKKSGSDPVKEVFSLESWKELSKVPCVRPSLLWGLGTGGVMAAHKLRSKKMFLPAFTWGIFTFTIVSSWQFWLCKKDWEQKYFIMEKAMTVQGFKHASELSEDREKWTQKPLGYNEEQSEQPQQQKDD